MLATATITQHHASQNCGDGKADADGHAPDGDDAAEEVGVLAERLVADHDRALRHHSGLDLGSHLIMYNEAIRLVSMN